MPQKTKNGRPKTKDSQCGPKLIETIVEGMQKQITIDPSKNFFDNLLSKAKMKSNRGGRPLDPAMLVEEPKPEYPLLYMQRNPQPATRNEM